MKKIVLLFVFIFTLFGSQKERITFGINPWSSPDNLQEMYKPLMEYLSAKLGMEVNLIISKDYNNLIELVSNGKIEIASFSPNLYIQAKKIVPNLKYIATTNPLRSDGEIESGYSAIIVALKTSEIKTIKDLKGRTFGFTDIASTSGYLIPSVLLKENSMNSDDFKKYYFLKKHDKVISSIAKGSIDAGATYGEMLVDGIKKYGNIFYVIAKSPKIPYDAIVIKPNLQKDLSDKIEDAILSYKNPNPKILGEPIKFNALGDSAYDFVRNLDIKNNK